MVRTKDLVLDPNSVEMHLHKTYMESACKSISEGEVAYLEISCASGQRRPVVPSRSKGDERVVYNELHGL